MQGYFQDTLRKLQTMVSGTSDGEQTLRKYGFAKREIEKMVIRPMERQVDRINERFPGANSISFMVEHLKEVNCRKTVVCEKTDGVRFFLCEVNKMMQN